MHKIHIVPIFDSHQLFFSLETHRYNYFCDPLHLPIGPSTANFTKNNASHLQIIKITPHSVSTA